MLPVYFEKSVSNVRMENIPPKVAIAWMTDAVLMDVSEPINIISTTQMPERT